MNGISQDQGRSARGRVLNGEGAHTPRGPRRGTRCAPVLWMTVLALFVVGVGVLPAAGDPIPSLPTATIAIRVSSTDTLWTIAAANRLPGLSTAQMVRVICEANALSAGGLDAGAVLRVPARSVSGTAYAQATVSPSAQ